MPALRAGSVGAPADRLPGPVPHAVHTVLGGRPVGVREPDQFRARGLLRPQAGQQVLCLRLPLRAGILVGGLPRHPRGDARPGSSATRGNRRNRPRRGCSAHRCARARSWLRHAPGITLHPQWRASLLHGPHAAIAPACEQVAEAILHKAPATLFSVHYSLLTPMRLPRVHATAAEPDSPGPHTAARRSHYPPHCDQRSGNRPPHESCPLDPPL